MEGEEKATCRMCNKLEHIREKGMCVECLMHCTATKFSKYHQSYVARRDGVSIVYHRKHDPAIDWPVWIVIKDPYNSWISYPCRKGTNGDRRAE